MQLKINFSIFLFATSLFLNIQAQRVQTVKIGKQEWMTLNVDSAVNGSYYFDNDTLRAQNFGRLYDWQTAITICPSGFHLPTDEEWTELTDTLGGIDVAGRKLLISGSSGFNAPLSGNYNKTLDILSFVGKNAYFWTATSFNANVAWFRQISKDQTNINRSTVDKSYFFSVRCIKDND